MIRSSHLPVSSRRMPERKAAERSRVATSVAILVLYCQDLVDAAHKESP